VNHTKGTELIDSLSFIVTTLRQAIPYAI